MVKTQNIKNTKLVAWDQTVESVISTLEQNSWETSSFLAETFIIVSNFAVHSHSHKSLWYILLLNPLQCYPPSHLGLLHLCFSNSCFYQEASSIEVLLLNMYEYFPSPMCATCLAHYILDFTSLTVGKFMMFHIMQFSLALSEFQIFSLPLLIQNLQFIFLLKGEDLISYPYKMMKNMRSNVV